MAHFSRVRVFGLWVVNSTLQPAEMELFDAQLSKAINGDEGGVWAPSSLIEVGGSGIKITGPCVVTSEAQLQGGATVTGGNLAVANDANIQGNATVGGTLEVAGETTITDTLNVAVALMVQDGAAIGGEIVGLAGATITGGDLNVGDDIVCQGNAEIAGTLDVDGNAAIGGTLGVGSTTVTGTLTATGNASLGGTLAVTGDATLSGTTIARGRFRRRVLTMGDAGATVSVADYDLVYMPQATLTMDRTLNVSTTGAVEGDVIRVTSRDATYFLDVDFGGDVNSLKMITAQLSWLELTFISGAWVRTAFGDRGPLATGLLDGAAREPEAARALVARLTLRPAVRRPRLPASSAGAPRVGVTWGAGPVAAPLGVADLSPLASPGAGARLLPARGADLGGVFVGGAGHEGGEE